MQIAIDARGLSIPIGGARNLLGHYLRHLPSAGTNHEFTAFQPEGSPVFDGVEPIRLPASHPLIWERLRLPGALRSCKPDVLLEPKTLVPPGLPSQLAVVILVLDLLYFTIPGRGYCHEYKPADILYMRLRFRASCRRADRIVCISHNTEKDLLALAPECAGKTAVVRPGVHRTPVEQMSAGAIREARCAHGLDRPYIFYAGSLSPRKNMARGVRAWASIADRIPHDLVVTAGKSWRDGPVYAAVRETGLQGRFRRLGNVPTQRMNALYAGADCFFYPSLYEGFGLPILEAMACGCPVVASGAGALSEAAEDAALAVDPMDEQDMAAGLLTVLTEPGLADDLRGKGLARAASCSWEASAEALLREIEKAVAP